jgi:hypothetical protein
MIFYWPGIMFIFEHTCPNKLNISNSGGYET